MKASWNPAQKKYQIEMTEKELGVLIFALTCAKYETKDPAVAELQKAYLNLNSSGAV